MGKFIPDSLKNAVQEEISKIEDFKRILSEEEIEAYIGKVVEFYEDIDNKGKVYFDGSRHWVFIQTPEPNEDEEGNTVNKPRKIESKYTDGYVYNWRVKFNKGPINISFATGAQIKALGWNNFVLVTGKLRIQYKIGSSNEYYSTLEEVAKALNLVSVDELENQQYYELYSFRIWQVIDNDE